MSEAPLSRYRQSLRRMRRTAARYPRVERVLGERVVPVYGRTELFFAKRWRRFGRGSSTLTRKNTRRGYEELYASDVALAEYVSSERVALYEAIAEECAQLRPRSLIDVGCGSGHFLQEVETRLGSSCVLLGVDYARTGIERLRGLVPRAEGLVANLNELDLGGRAFDVVVCMQVLEHLVDPDGALEALSRLRHGSSVILISVPDGDLDSFEGHEQFWTAAEFVEFLGPLGHVSIRRFGGDLLARIDSRRAGGPDTIGRLAGV